jgi:uncharacterized protein YggE
MDNKIYIAAVLIVGIVLAAWYVIDVKSPVVSATGTATIKAAPDEVSVYLYIQTRNKTAEATQTSNAAIREALVSALKQAGIAEKDIQFQSYNIYPDYDWSSGTQRQKGFIASQYIVVKTADFTKTSVIVDKAVQAGSLVSNIDFELSDAKQAEYKAQALEEAGKDAQTKAAATASGLGKSVGRLVAVQSQEYNYPGPLMYYEKSDVASAGEAGSYDNSEAIRAAANLAPQDIEISATLQVQYKLS